MSQIGHNDMPADFILIVISKPLISGNVYYKLNSMLPPFHKI